MAPRNDGKGGKPTGHKGKGKGKGKPFAGECYECGVWGHRAFECPKKRPLASLEESPQAPTSQEEQVPTESGAQSGGAQSDGDYWCMNVPWIPLQCFTVVPSKITTQNRYGALQLDHEEPDDDPIYIIGPTLVEAKVC